MKRVRDRVPRDDRFYGATRPDDGTPILECDCGFTCLRLRVTSKQCGDAPVEIRTCPALVLQATEFCNKWTPVLEKK
jgi:hypothetical protein